MSTSGVIDDFKHEIEEAIQNHERALGRGEASDFPEYKDSVGKIKGLKKAQNLFMEVLDKYLNIEEASEDDDD